MKYTDPYQAQAIIFGFLLREENKVQTSKMNKLLEELNYDKVTLRELKELPSIFQENPELLELVKKSLENEVGLEDIVMAGSTDKRPFTEVDPHSVITPYVVDKERMKARNKEFNKTKREGAYLKILLEDLQEALSEEYKTLQQTATPKMENFDTKLEGSSLVVTLSDLHIGAVVTEHPAIGKGYNYEILQTRLTAYEKEIKRITQLTGADNIRVYVVGDLIENSDMRSNQSFDNEFTTAAQIAKAQRTLYEFASRLEALLPVKLGIVNGNHDRLSGVRNKKEKIYNDSVAYVIIDNLLHMQEQGLLQNTEIIDNRLATHIFFDDVDGKRVVVTHGDHLKKGDKFPQIRTEHADLGFSGHLHSHNSVQENEEQVWIQVGSIMGSNTYSAENNFHKSSPSQTLAVVNKELKGVLMYPVYFD